MTHHVFVYGTLRPGDVRWHVLEPFTLDGGVSDSVSGELFDTGLDYPAAVFGPSGTILGQTFALLEATLDRAIAVLDEVEDVVGGEYHRVMVRTHLGLDAWAYSYGAGLDLTPIPSGDWLAHRPLS
ncbi:MAG TPA: gamma-glutamylcyclotransferase family protein [Ilumatobacteraceae bacterium]|nr:gamma-glutamylcyclotransferase family protein [Ilumatobacteraceae bacterium]